MSLTLLASDGSPIAGIAEVPVTYEVTERACAPSCFEVRFEGSTL